MFEYFNNIWNYLHNLSSSYEGEIENDSIAHDWEWILDPHDKRFQEQYRETIKDELHRLQIKGKMIKSRNIIRGKCQSLICNLDNETRLLLTTVKLPSDNLGSILRSYINTVSPYWQQFCMVNFPEHQHFFSHIWHESRYSKNTCGQILSLAHCAALSVQQCGLQERQLCDIIWAIRVGLKSIIVNEIGYNLDIRTSNDLNEQLIKTIHIYLDLYIESVHQIGKSLEKMGNLPQKWADEDKIHMDDMRRVKEEGVDASFNDGPMDKYDNTIPLITKNEYDGRRLTIENMMIRNINSK